MDITVQLVRRLIDTQFPQWRELEIRPVAKSGHDNRTFHLGDKMAVRLPSGREYVPQVEKEAKWLPYLAEKLSLPISCPVAAGSPSDEYPFPWSVNGYLEGETALEAPIPDLERFAEELAAFLAELQTVYTEGAPAAGEHNFFRGANPIVYHEQVKQALQDCQDGLQEEKLRTIWEKAIASQWEWPPVWIHGDIAPGNLLVKEGHLCGVIDFGTMGVGDPACDYAMAWTFFDSKSRKCFLHGLDENTVSRARGWALWKALITRDASDPMVSANAKATIQAILEEYDAEL